MLEEDDSDLECQFGFINLRSMNRYFEYLDFDHVMMQHEILFLSEMWKYPMSQKSYILDWL